MALVRPSSAPMTTSCLFLFLWLLTLTQAALMDRCGDCFCAPDGNTTTCPDETGIVDSLDKSTHCVLESFRLANNIFPDFLFLQSTADGGGSECYPFAASIGTIESAPQTALPACVIPPDLSETAAVCAYKYNDAETTCTGREYEVLNYDSTEAAIADGAYVTHAGGTCKSIGFHRQSSHLSTHIPCTYTHTIRS